MDRSWGIHCFLNPSGSPGGSPASLRWIGATSTCRPVRCMCCSARMGRQVDLRLHRCRCTSTPWRTDPIPQSGHRSGLLFAMHAPSGSVPSSRSARWFRNSRSSRTCSWEPGRLRGACWTRKDRASERPKSWSVSASRFVRDSGWPGCLAPSIKCWQTLPGAAGLRVSHGAGGVRHLVGGRRGRVCEEQGLQGEGHGQEGEAE